MSPPKIRAQAPQRRMGSLYPSPSLAQERQWRSQLWILYVGNVLLHGHMSPVTPGDTPSVCQGEEQQGSAFPVPGGHGALPCC